MSTLDLVCIKCGTIRPDCGCVVPTCVCGNKTFVTESAYYKFKSKGIDLNDIHTMCPDCVIKGTINNRPLRFCKRINKLINKDDGCKA